MGSTYNLCNYQPDFMNECNLSAKIPNSLMNTINNKDGPIDKDKIAEYFIVNDDIVNYQGRETYSFYSLSKSRLYKNEASTSLSLSHNNQLHIAHFDIFINNNYVINTDWEKTDIFFLIQDRLPQSMENEVIFLGELLTSKEEPINLIQNHSSSFCVLTRTELLLYANKNEYNIKGQDYTVVDIEDIDQILMFQYKPGDNKNMFYCIGLLVLQEGINEQNALIYYFYSEIKTMVCYWMKLLSFLSNKKMDDNSTIMLF